MLKIIVLLILVAIAVLLIVAARRPNTFRIERSITIKATPEKISGLVNDFHQWDKWSPWEKLDATMTKKFSGENDHKGAIYEWKGNKQVGQGRMEILDVIPNSKTVIQLDFIKPFEGHNTTRFSYLANGNFTEVTWVMDGPSPFISKIMGVLMNMDAMIGKDFEAGLANLKKIAEAQM